VLYPLSSFVRNKVDSNSSEVLHLGKQDKEQWRLMRIMNLIIHKSNLSPEQAMLLVNLVEYLLWM